MGHASAIPETHTTRGDHALDTLRRVGWGRLVADSFERFRVADGFSHARALAFQITLTAIPALIAMVGLAAVVDQDVVKQALQRSVEGLAPGPTDRIFDQALQQGAESGGDALLFGIVAALASGTFAMAQIERGANRIYGIDQDRSTVTKYGMALLMTVSAGTLSFAAFILLVAGPAIAEAARTSADLSDSLATAWTAVRWPVGVVLVIASFALLFQRSPRRSQPSMSWLAIGSTVSVILWVSFTVGLRVYIDGSRGLGETYGPLAGLIGVLLWAFLTSISVFLGLALTAQLEAVRAGVPSPSTH